MLSSLIAGSSKGAVFSDSRDYRYVLWRIWDRSKPYVLFVGLNPSTADENQDDPTIDRCRCFAESWGYGGILMVNLFAYCATDPADMKKAADSIGSDNDEWIVRAAKDAGLVVAAWGNDGDFMDRPKQVMEFVPNMSCLGMNNTGQPKHPLYVKGDVTPQLMDEYLKQVLGKVEETPALSKAGFVYLLEVQDIMLPVCKVGMTVRDPKTRCEEINAGATGDFRWEVVHKWPVNDCRAFESLVHEKLKPLRQKGKEFFNLPADDAITAIQSILDNQMEIATVSDLEPMGVTFSAPKVTKKKRKSKKYEFHPEDQESAELMLTFAEMLKTKAKPFGQLNRPYFGVSDNNDGVQWNLRIYRGSGAAALGVNLEGLSYEGKWPIATFLLKEFKEPTLHQLLQNFTNPNAVDVSLTRDAWLPSGSRLSIVEAQIGGDIHPLSHLTQEKWSAIIAEGLECLNVSKGYRGRIKQAVTHTSDGRITEKWVTPHLTLRTELSPVGSAAERLHKCFDVLRPVYDWVLQRIED
jgi:hypothetical protein